MISGQVTSQRQAVVEIDIAGLRNSPQSVREVVDTGYLTLPADQIRAMGLPFAGYRRGQLADGRKVLLEMYLVAVTWHGELRTVLAAETKGAVLMGMSLLHGSELRINVVDGGHVILEKKA